MNLHIMKGKSIAVASNAADGVEMHQMQPILFNAMFVSCWDVTATAGNACVHAIQFADITNGDQRQLPTYLPTYQQK